MNISHLQSILANTVATLLTLTYLTTCSINNVNGASKPTDSISSDLTIPTPYNIGIITEPYGIVVGQTTLAEAKKLTELKWEYIEEIFPSVVAEGLSTSANKWNVYRFQRYYTDETTEPDAMELYLVLYVDKNAIVQRMSISTKRIDEYSNTKHILDKMLKDTPQPSIFSSYYLSSYLHHTKYTTNAEMIRKSAVYQDDNRQLYLYINKSGPITLTKEISDLLGLGNHTPVKILFNDFDKLKWESGDSSYDELIEYTSLTIVSDKYVNTYDQIICNAIAETKDTEKRAYLMSDLPQDVCQ